MQHDFECTDTGEVATITPRTERAHDWLTENAPSYTLKRLPNVLNTFAGDPPGILDLAFGMLAAGLTCENTDWVRVS